MPDGLPALLPTEVLPSQLRTRGSHPLPSDDPIKVEQEEVLLERAEKVSALRKPGGPGRDRYIDSLRVVALVRVMTFHTFGWLWLPLIFPSMNIMFALAGGLMASSLDRSAHHPWPVLAKRLRRLLPPLWAMGLILIPIMLLGGWMHEGSVEDGTNTFSWLTFTAWLVPWTIPPGSEAATDWVVPLWYIRTYMYLMVLSPAMLWSFRRWPIRTFIAPLVLLAIISAGVFDLSSGLMGDTITSICIFASSWMLGFMHHKRKGETQSRLRSIKGIHVLSVSLILMAAGYFYGLTHPGDIDGGWLPGIDDIPMADAIYGLGFAAILLRFYPNFDWMKKVRPLDALVTAVNSRAMTIYLWGNLAIYCATPVLNNSPLARWYLNDWKGMTMQYLAAWLVVVVAVLLLGWVEDVAGKRKPRLLPWKTSEPMTSAKHRFSGLRRLIEKADF